jgi:hypothetical protein
MTAETAATAGSRRPRPNESLLPLIRVTAPGMSLTERTLSSGGVVNPITSEDAFPPDSFPKAAGAAHDGRWRRLNGDRNIQPSCLAMHTRAGEDAGALRELLDVVVDAE